MKAIVQDRYGPPEEVLELRDIDRPQIADDEVLIRVRASCVHPDVWHVVTGRPWILRLMGAGFRRPLEPVPGTDVAGVVEAVGSAVARFSPGDAVFGETHSKLQWVNGGAFAEYVAAPEDTLALGFARGWYSDSLAGQSTETVLECAYNWYINDVLTVTPNLQYVVTPGGTGTVDDALILGLLTYITY